MLARAVIWPNNLRPELMPRTFSAMFDLDLDPILYAENASVQKDGSTGLYLCKPPDKTFVGWVVVGLIFSDFICECNFHEALLIDEWDAAIQKRSK